MFVYQLLEAVERLAERESYDNKIELSRWQDDGGKEPTIDPETAGELGAN